jgi:deazaflavin-dependent oxidoreductase (nitroreductase family)
MPAVSRGPALKFYWRLHKWILQMTSGRLFARVGKLDVLMLRTTGRKSGQPRLTALSFVPHAAGYAVVASNAGADSEPSWWLNLQAKPRAELEIRGVRFAVTWRIAQGDEAEKLYAKFVEAEPGYAEYRQRTARKIQVLILEPAS